MHLVQAHRASSGLERKIGRRSYYVKRSPQGRERSLNKSIVIRGPDMPDGHADLAALAQWHIRKSSGAR
jgi:hypothetical protein